MRNFLLYKGRIQNKSRFADASLPDAGIFMEHDKSLTKIKIVIPLFPLPATVFYPNTDLPLHIFEPRYRSMVADALEGEGKIGMVLLKPGWEENYYDTPEIQTIGCVGKIEHHSQLPEGKYNILLAGLHRFRILHEIEGKPYRQAQVELLEEVNDRDLTAESVSAKDQIIKIMKQYLGNIPGGEKVEQELNMESCDTLAQFIDQIAYHFDLPASKMQEFLEEQDVEKRAKTLHSLIELKIQLIQISKRIKKGGIDFSMN